MNDAAALLLDTARRGELHHAIILHGPAPDALRALAVQVAKTMNCPNGTTGDDCAACQRIERRTHPDVHVLEVGAERKLISVEQVRDVVAAATLRPYEGRSKVFIIDPADALSIGGSNSLLKTLEEPPRDTHFILLTRSVDLLLPTIRSRSQPVYIGGVEPRDETLASEIVSALKRYGDTGESATLLALAALIASQEHANDAIALLGTTLGEAVAGTIDVAIPRERLLAAADATTAAIRWLTVNADTRLLVEQIVSALAPHP
jgi:DNA polymerase III delta prime subunit